MALGDIQAMINIGAALGLIVTCIIIGHKSKLLGFLGFSAVFGTGLSYIVSVFRSFQVMFDMFSWIPIIGIFLRDLPDILAIMLNYVGPEIRWAGPMALWVGRALWGALFGIALLDIPRKFLGEEGWSGASGMRKLFVISMSVMLTIMTLLLICYQLSEGGCAFVDSLCRVREGIYTIIIPVVLVGTFVVNLAAFFITIANAFSRSEGDTTTMFKESFKDIFSAVMIIGVFSFKVIIPLLSPTGGTIVNVW
jgi:hypothetical protein